MKTSWNLEDADPIAQEAKYTFYKPSRRIIGRLNPGDSCKLIFKFESADPKHPSAERMWVLIDEVKDGGFSGLLDNDPLYITDLKAGDVIPFGPQHVIDVSIEDDEPNLPAAYVNRCLATRRIIYEGRPIGYLYREAPMEGDIKGAKDSGWRILEGNEDQAYIDESDNCQFVSLGSLLNNDDAFKDLLDEPIGSAFIRDEETGNFIRLED